MRVLQWLGRARVRLVPWHRQVGPRLPCSLALLRYCSCIVVCSLPHAPPGCSALLFPCVRSAGAMTVGDVLYCSEGGCAPCPVCRGTVRTAGQDDVASCNARVHKNLHVTLQQSCCCSPCQRAPLRLSCCRRAPASATTAAAPAGALPGCHLPPDGAPERCHLYSWRPAPVLYIACT